MKWRNSESESEYLMTCVFAMDYFHYYSDSLTFATALLPFIEDETLNTPYEIDTKEEFDKTLFEKKMHNIKIGRHGNYTNYASQGLSYKSFYKPYVSYLYFYNKLCFFDRMQRIKYPTSSLESEPAKQDLRYILKKKGLKRKIDKDVPEDIKETLLQDLDTSEVKAVLAKMIYYIVSSDHVLPDVQAENIKANKERIRATEEKLNTQFRIMPNMNVCIGNRSDLDDDLNVISDRIKQAKEIQICCFDGVSLFGDKEITPVIQQNIIDSLHERADNDPDFNFEMILSEYRYDFFKNAAQFQVNIPHLRCEKKGLPSKTLSRIKDLTSSIHSDKIAVKLTDFPLPYALFIMKFDDELSDYVKVDMYSPMIDDNKSRPCFYVFRQIDQALFDHFVSTFEKMWKSDEYSYFTERDNGSD